jgi:hypothetical protein
MTPEQLERAEMLHDKISRLRSVLNPKQQFEGPCEPSLRVLLDHVSQPTLDLFKHQAIIEVTRQLESLKIEFADL